MTNPTNTTNHLSVLMTPRRPGLARGQDNVVDVLVRVQASGRPADMPQRLRHDLNIALVIDRSGSMSGAPLAEAIRAAEFVIDHLEPRDRCAIVVYDDRATLIVPAQHVIDKAHIKAAIRNVRTGGNTDLHQGWLTGAEALAPFTAKGAISRVILLSDGNANAGVTNPATIAAQVERLAAAGVTTSTLGLGRNFNEALMAGVARAGRGRAYYGETAEDLMGPFREEFALLNAIAGSKVSCLLKPVPGIGMEVLNPYPRDAQGRIILPDVAWGSEAVIAVRLSVPKSMVDGTPLVELLSASVAYSDVDGVVRGAASVPLMLPVMEASVWSAVVEDETVARRFGEVEASHLQQQARLAALDGNWDAVDRILRQIREMAGNNAWVSGMLDEIERLARRRDRERFSKEAMYSADSLGSRLSEIGESYDMSVEARRESYLVKKLGQGQHRKRD
jgi:Ca-activated chloride channel family protein